MLIGLELLLLIFSTGFKQYDCAAICFSCTEMLEDEKCQHVTTCQDNEVCFIQVYKTSDNRRLYDVGCTHNQLCLWNTTAVSVGRRSVDHSHILCHQCCNGNVCNSAFTCDDNIKPQSLNCLSCGGIGNVHNCSSTTTCDNDEVCYIQKYRTADNIEWVDLGCKRSTMCINMNPSNIFGRRTEEEKHLLCELCCGESSLCNRDLDCGHNYPTECADISFQKDGVYKIYPQGRKHPKSAYCINKNGIKWTVIQKKSSTGSLDFNRTWEEYKLGFGNVDEEHWLGNEAIHLMSSNGRHKVHIDMKAINGSRFYAEYSLFRLNDENSNYLLNITGYSGTAGNSMDGIIPEGKANGAQFSTIDRDNDAKKEGSCAADGGWWYMNCNNSYLNGNVKSRRMYWYFDLGYPPTIVESMMMITKY